MTDPIFLRGGTEYEWATVGPTLAAREVGVTTDTHRLKVGDGVTPWASLPYVDAAAATVVPLVAVDEDYEVTASDHTVVALPGCTTVTLPVGYGDPGRSVVVKATTDPVTITGTEDIDTETTVTLDPWEALTVTATGAQWVIV
jgi:hypothetical protein